MIGRRTRGLTNVKEDVRSSIFTAFAQWAAARVTPEAADNVRAWKPNLLVPVEDVEHLRGSYPLLLDLAQPEGSLKLLGLTTETTPEVLGPRLERIGRSIRETGVLASWSIVDLPEYTPAVTVGMEALQGAFFRPNLLFTRLPSGGSRRQEKLAAFRSAMANRVGVLIYGAHPSAGLGRKQDIRLWVRRVWKGTLTIATVVSEGEDVGSARRFLDELCDLARFPESVERMVVTGDLVQAIRSQPVPDMTIFGLQRSDPNLDWAEQMVRLTRSSCLFVLDSGRESARA